MADGPRTDRGRFRRRHLLAALLPVAVVAATVPYYAVGVLAHAAVEDAFLNAARPLVGRLSSYDRGLYRATWQGRVELPLPDGRVAGLPLVGVVEHGLLAAQLTAGLAPDGGPSWLEELRLELAVDHLSSWFGRGPPVAGMLQLTWPGRDGSAAGGIDGTPLTLRFAHGDGVTRVDGESAAWSFVTPGYAAEVTAAGATAVGDRHGPVSLQASVGRVGLRLPRALVDLEAVAVMLERPASERQGRLTGELTVGKVVNRGIPFIRLDDLRSRLDGTFDASAGTAWRLEGNAGSNFGPLAWQLRGTLPAHAMTEGTAGCLAAGLDLELHATLPAAAVNGLAAGQPRWLQEWLTAGMLRRVDDGYRVDAAYRRCRWGVGQADPNA